MRSDPRPLAWILLLAGVCCWACSTADPRSTILEERARWKVQLMSWTPTGPEGVVVDTRISGPTNSPLERLTVRFDLLDERGDAVDRIWHTYDLSQVPRGGPKDFLVHLRTGERTLEVASLGLRLVLEPTPEDEPHIPELSP